MSQITLALWKTEFSDWPMPRNCTYAQFRSMVDYKHRAELTDLYVELLNFYQNINDPSLEPLIKETSERVASDI